MTTQRFPAEIQYLTPAADFSARGCGMVKSCRFSAQRSRGQAARLRVRCRSRCGQDRWRKLILQMDRVSPRKLVAFDKTHKIFTNPSDERTEDYITRRFG